MAETMSNADHFWLGMDEPTNRMVITAFMEFDAPVDFKRLQATIDSRLASFPRFQQRLVPPATGVGLPSWETDPHYDLRTHVQRIALPSPGDKSELQKLIGNLSITPLDPDRPLWHVMLIENYGKGCLLFYRIHHCIADGIALVHVLLESADTDPDAPWSDEQTEKARAKGRMRLPSLDTLMTSLQGTVRTTRRMGAAVVDQLGKTLSNPAQLPGRIKNASRLPTDTASVLARMTLLRSDPKTPFKGRLGVRKQFAWTEPMALERIKAVGKALGAATINDVLIATVTGAMRHYLKTRNVSVNELDLQATIPVNIRRPGTEKELGNKFSLIFLSLPVYLKDPILRVKEVKRRMDQLKRSPDPVINFGLLSAIGYLPPDKAKKAAHLFGDKASCVLTNVPGPRQPLYFAGSRIDNFMFWVPRSGQLGLGISILSYDGKVTVGITSDERLMPDPEALLEGFHRQFDHLDERVRSGRIDDQPLVLHDRYEEAQEQPADGSDPAGSGFGYLAPGQCGALTRSGRPCRNKALAGTRFCHLHKNSADEKARLKDVTRLMRELVE